MVGSTQMVVHHGGTMLQDGCHRWLLCKGLDGEAIMLRGHAERQGVKVEILWDMEGVVVLHPLPAWIIKMYVFVGHEGVKLQMMGFNLQVAFLLICSKLEQRHLLSNLHLLVGLGVGLRMSAHHCFILTNHLWKWLLELLAFL